MARVNYSGLSHSEALKQLLVQRDTRPAPMNWVANQWMKLPSEELRSSDFYLAIKSAVDASLAAVRQADLVETKRYVRLLEALFEALGTMAEKRNLDQSVMMPINKMIHAAFDRADEMIVAMSNRDSIDRGLQYLEQGLTLEKIDQEVAQGKDSLPEYTTRDGHVRKLSQIRVDVMRALKAQGVDPSPRK